MGVALCCHVCDQEYDQGAALRSPLHSYSRTYVHQLLIDMHSCEVSVCGFHDLFVPAHYLCSEI